MRYWRPVAVTTILLVVIVGGSFFLYIHNLLPFFKNGNNGTVTSPDGSVVLHIPSGAQLPGTEVVFKPDPAATKTLNDSAKGFSTLATPVDIDVVHGTLTPGRVQVVMSYPHTLPHGVTPANLGIAIFDPTFDAWMPLPVTLNVRNHTVMAVAPHFSTFALVFLNAAKSVVTFGSIVIHTQITGEITIAKWFLALSNELITTLVKELFGIAPSLSCSPVSPDLVVTTRSFLNRLTACARGSHGNETLMMRNGFGFPLRMNRFPSGITQEWGDVFTNGGDPVDLLRNVYWKFLGEAVLPGANIGSVTTLSSMQQSVNLSLNLDALSIGEDVVLAVLQLFTPVGTVADASDDGLKAVLRTLTSVTKVAGVSGVMSWVQQGFGMLTCLNTAAHNGLFNPKSFDKLNIGTIVNVAKDCVGSVLGAVHLDSILTDILGSLSIIPEVVESIIAEALNKVLPTGNNLNTTSYQINVQRFNAQAVMSTYIGQWHVHAYDLTINANRTGSDVWHDGFTPDGAWCNGNDAIAFTVEQDGSLLGTITSVWYTPASGCMPVDNWQAGDQFTLAHQGDHLLYQTWLPPIAGQNYLCDPYAAQNGWDQCGA